MAVKEMTEKYYSAFRNKERIEKFISAEKLLKEDVDKIINSIK